jgi:hypothetical protein
MNGRRSTRIAFVAVIAVAAIVSPRPLAQQRVPPAPPAPDPKLSAVLSAFLAEASSPSRVLPWTAGNDLPLDWKSKGPVPVTDLYLSAKGITHSRGGSGRANLDGGAPKEIRLLAYGSTAGIQRVTIGLDYAGDGSEPEPMDRIGRGLAADGFKLGHLKCRREGEGVIGGNVVYLLEAPDRHPAALLESWSCSHDGACSLELGLLDPKADLTDVECHG